MMRSKARGRYGNRTIDKLLKTQSMVAYAISDETRRRVLSRLINSPASLTDLAHEFNISKPLMHYHLKILQDAGLIKIVSTRKCGRGPKRKYYGLTITGVQVVKSLLQASSRSFKGSFVVVKFITNNDPYVYKVYKRSMQLLFPVLLALAGILLMGTYSFTSPAWMLLNLASLIVVPLVLLCFFFVVISRIDWLRERLLERVR